MKKIHLFVFMAVCSLGLQWLVFFNSMAHAEDSIGDSIDCTVRVLYVDDPSLTHEERLRLMDKAFLESLDKFELCRAAKEAAAVSEGAVSNGDGATADSGDSSGGSSGNYSGNSSGNSSGEAGGTSVGESAASSEMSGTEAPENNSFEEGIETMAQGGLQGSQTPEEADNKAGGNNTSGNMKKSNGKLPEDIPTAQNDDALAAQIRYAAENETDPVKREQLWNEYRKYKGLPTQ